MTVVTEKLKSAIDNVRKGLGELEQGVEKLEKKVLETLETARTRFAGVQVKVDTIPAQVKEAFALVTKKGQDGAFATKGEVQALIAKIEELEAKLATVVPVSAPPPARKAKLAKA